MTSIVWGILLPFHRLGAGTYSRFCNYYIMLGCEVLFGGRLYILLSLFVLLYREGPSSSYGGLTGTLYLNISSDTFLDHYRVTLNFKVGARARCL
jgi:hypothetical protein